MWSLECKHQMLTHDGRRTTTDGGQPLTTIAHHEHFVLRWAKKTKWKMAYCNISVHKIPYKENIKKMKTIIYFQWFKNTVIFQWFKNTVMFTKYNAWFQFWTDEQYCQCWDIIVKIASVCHQISSVLNPREKPVFITHRLNTGRPIVSHMNTVLNLMPLAQIVSMDSVINKWNMLPYKGHSHAIKHFKMIK